MFVNRSVLFTMTRCDVWGLALIKSVTFQSFLPVDFLKCSLSREKYRTSHVNILHMHKSRCDKWSGEMLNCIMLCLCTGEKEPSVMFRSYPLVWQWAQCVRMETREHQGGFWPSTCRSHYRLALRLSERWKRHREQGYRATGYDLRTDPPRGGKPVRRSGKTTGRQER